MPCDLPLLSRLLCSAAYIRTILSASNNLYINLKEGCWKTYQSRNRPTHSFKSPRVSYLGYTAVTTLTAGRLRLTSARKCSGKSSNVASSPYQIEVICQSSTTALSLVVGRGVDDNGTCLVQRQMIINLAGNAP